ncbi:CaiB/BaiF CoA transferase family protein [Primorskyibacter sp. 2E233]|uniref:CaiB/BaiF CoA transferase family protein n=1 Tax=Primorskyibacter sp. 2E233 TaxID=3413431 RepID=UPI003BF26479
MTGAFSGLRVIDTTHVLAGPYASYQLALLGAEVIKLEAPNDPDQARFNGTDRDLVRAAMGTAFLAQGAGKKTLALDLKSEAGRDALLKLAETADVFVENYRPGAFTDLGLSYEDLAAVNPRLIYCSVSAFGATGPRQHQTGYDNIIQAFSGIMDMTGHGDDRPLKCGAPVVDYATGLTAAFAISAALFQRERTGKGQNIEVSMLDVAMTLMTTPATDFLWTGKHPKAKGNSYAFATLGMYQAADEPLMIAASNLRQQRRLWVGLGREDLVKTDNLARIDDYKTEHAVLASIIETMPAAYWEEFFNERRVPASRIRRLEEALQDPQAEARAQFLKLADPSGRLEGLRVPSVAFRMSASDTGVNLPPQEVGAHTADILRSIGLGNDEIEALCLAGLALQAAQPTCRETAAQ